jgi:hypothetical protein
MKYFLHDTSAIDDEKVAELFINFGYEGIGLFYVILEKLGKQEKPVKTAVLKSQLKVGKKLEKCWNFMESIGIISSNNGETFNKQLLNFSEKFLIKKEKTRKKVEEWRKNQEDKENVTSYVPNCNQDKDNISKDNISKEILKGEFLKFWDLYPVKVGKSVCEKKWQKLTQSEKENIFNTIETFKKYKPFTTYNHPNPETYLNQKRWNDEINIPVIQIKDIPTVYQKGPR